MWGTVMATTVLIRSLNRHAEQSCCVLEASWVFTGLTEWKVVGRQKSGDPEAFSEVLSSMQRTQRATVDPIL